MNIEQSYNELQEIEIQLAELKKRKNIIEYDVAKHFEDEINTRLCQKPDHCGTVTINLDGFNVSYNITKKVEWDQQKLSALYKTISEHEDAGQYIKVKYDVSETMFKNWPKDIQEAFIPARTLKPGAGKLTIVKKDDQ